MKYRVYIVIASLLLIIIGVHARMTIQSYNNNQQRLSTLKAQIVQIDSELSVLYKKIAELNNQKSKLNEQSENLESLLARA